MAGKLLLINPRRRRRVSAKKRRARRHNAMPPALARYWASKRASNPKRRRKWKRPSNRAASIAGRVLRHRRRNPVALGGILNRIVPMTVDAVTGAAGAVAVDWTWGQINSRLPAMLQTAPGSVGVGDAVKVAATVALGTLLDRPTRGLAMKAAKGALTVQMDRIIRQFLPDNIRMSLAYAGPAPVVQGQVWAGPNRVYRGTLPNTVGASPNTVGALLRPGGPSPLLSGTQMGAFTRPGSPSPLLNAAPRGGVRVRY